MLKWLAASLTCLLLWFLPPASAHGDDALQSYALVVGSNRGGPGQHALAYAEDDAERMGALLVELGRTPGEHVALLTAPSAAEVRSALVDLQSALAAHAARGERTQVLFYYSGHARAHALSLGDEELALSELRSALTGLPSTLTVVVLDACQSGAFSGVKGAQPAADFSIVSVSSLRSEGLAVMASSSGIELSQESAELGAGYFTHHLLVGLRGAGDVNADGRVSLDEAYRYAYTQTLSSTARTRVGTQHATLEVAISGRGEVPLTYTADADSQLVLPKALTGRILVQLPARGAVMAELVKASGSELVLALPAGRYDVLVRESSAPRALSCQLTLASGAPSLLDQSACQTVLLDDDTQKKDGAGPQLPFERWFFELGLSWSQRPNDAYIQTLRAFDYAPQLRWNWLGGPWDAARMLHANVAAGLGLTRHLSVLARFDGLERQAHSAGWGSGSAGDSSERTFHFRSHALSLGLRARYPLLGELVVPYVELDSGLGFGRNVLHYAGRDDVQRSYAPMVRGAGGMTLGRRLVGGYVAAGYVYAPITRNELGQRHNDGGAFVELGLRFHMLKGF